jgi:CHAT domain-containing protein
VGGLTESVQGFPQLPNVEAEIEAIKQQVSSDVLLDETFARNTFRDRLNELPFPIVHLATHGQFGEDLDSTFLLTHDDKINANELSAWLKFSEASRDAPIELLILSACETATGDDRAVLGLAGIAVRSGARSTLATLWQVDDAGTALFMSDFYQRLANTSQTKAKSLQQAQLRLLQREDELQDPYYWAPFVLIGNWL